MYTPSSPDQSVLRAPARPPGPPRPPVPFKRKRVVTLNLEDDTCQKKFKAPPTAQAFTSSMNTPKKPFKPPPKDWKLPTKPATSRRRKKEKKEEPVFQMTTSMVELDARDFEKPTEYKTTRPDPDLIIGRQRPTSLDNLVGQAEQVRDIRGWFEKFEKKSTGTPRCLMIVGPSGLGKSSAARLIFQEMGYLIHEYSSDDYVETTKKEKYSILSDKGIEEVLYKLLLRNQAFGKFGILLDGISPVKGDTQKHLIQVLSGQKYARQFNKNPDRVWLAPVILTCDHADFANFSAIARLCHVVEFEPASRADLFEFFQGVCQREQLDVPLDLQEKVVKGCGGDIRRLLNTLHFLTLDTIINTEQITSVIDVNTIFYDQHSMFGILESLLEQHRSKSLMELTDLLEFHPVSLAMLIQENHPRVYQAELSQYERQKNLQFNPSGCTIQVGATKGQEIENLEAMAQSAEYISSLDLMNHAVYHQHNWEMQEIFTTLSTWGVVKQFPDVSRETMQTFEKSAYFGWKKKEEYRRKLLASFPNLNQRGVDFISTASTVCEMIERHVRTKTRDDQLIEYCKHHRISYKDLQHIWKCAREGNMPNLRGKLSLCKLLSSN